MTITWQDIATACVVAAAAGYFARYVVRVIRRKSSPGCQCCTQCPDKKPQRPTRAGR